jgi:hypothetical protein
LSRNIYKYERRKLLNKRIIFVLALSVFFLLSFAKTQAVMVEVSLEQLVRDADLIVVGAVESVESQMINGKIFSFATISVSSKIKGELEGGQDKIIVKFPGGKVGDIGMKVGNSPNYKKDEEVVVFLKNLQGESHYLTAGSSQGKFIISDGVVLSENIPLDQFLARIESIVKADL